MYLILWSCWHSRKIMRLMWCLYIALPKPTLLLQNGRFPQLSPMPAETDSWICRSVLCVCTHIFLQGQKRESRSSPKALWEHLCILGSSMKSHVKEVSLFFQLEESLGKQPSQRSFAKLRAGRCSMLCIQWTEEALVHVACLPLSPFLWIFQDCPIRR